MANTVPNRLGIHTRVLSPPSFLKTLYLWLDIFPLGACYIITDNFRSKLNFCDNQVFAYPLLGYLGKRLKQT